ncbi:hypothetical protein AVEN_245901-1 [Araneus ventricosus]|uniref:Uncharacterized protein n=1 Tax=Araneus ventricosus TaxID=182803 RepID=A0A4Y2IH90_ARAVE|nr:hypothetical protein AVEN_245901-1 [Araneus ventricosus]
MAFCIQKFSSWFCFVFSTEESSFEQDFGSSCRLPINIKRFKEIIVKLYEMYSKELVPVFDKIFIDIVEEYSCFEVYMKAILSKCVELSRTPSKLHFLLVCTFIYGIISERSRREKKCFMFAKIASQCLLAVYDRHYKKLFKNEGDSE